MSELPPYYQEKVRANIDVDSLDSARETVQELTDTAKRCADLKPGGRAVEHRQTDGNHEPGRQAHHQAQQPNRPRRRPARPPGSAEPNC